MVPHEFLAPYLAANAIALAILALAVKRPSVARWLAVVIFLWAAITNATTAWRQPLVYLDYADLTPSTIYAAFIRGWFRAHIQPMVLAIAAGHLVLAGLLALRRPWRLAGVVGVLVFLAAIAPLGVGSGFPFSLTFGAAVVLADRRLARQEERRQRATVRAQGSQADRFLPDPDVFECQEVVVQAPADLVFAVARDFDLLSVPVVRAIFRARARLLGGVPPPDAWPQGLLAETRALGWRVLAEQPDRELVVGAATRPWERDVTFRGLDPEAFVAFADPDTVRIVWTIEAWPEPAGTRLRTQTRVAATDVAARRRFRRYWTLFGSGIILIRLVVLPAMRREAEARHRRQQTARLEARN